MGPATSTRSVIVWIVLASFYCLIVGGLFAAFLAQDVCPESVGPIVLVGGPVLAFPMGLVLVRMAIRGGRKKFATDLRASGQAICRACALASLGSLFALSARDDFNIIGIVISGCGTVGATWLFLKAVPVPGHRD